MPQALSVDGLTVSYGPATALRDVSLDVAEGSVTGVTGNNGAGKSTLMHALMGLVKPRRGQVAFFDESVTRASARTMSKMGVSLVPEGRHVFTDQSVRDNLRLGFVPRADVELRAVTERTLALFPELGDQLQRPAGALSGGQQQMLAVARALMSSPRLLLLDEPFLGLAPVIVDRLRDGIRRLAEQGITVLVSDSAAMRMLEFCDYSYVMRVGEVAAHGTRAELVQLSHLRSLLLGGA